MSTISALKRQTMQKLNNLQEEYKNELYNYLDSHNLYHYVIRVSDNRVGRIRLSKGQKYMLGKLAFYPLNKNGKFSRKKDRYVNESTVLEQYIPYEIDKDINNI